MSADNILADDLLQASGHFVAHALNRLPEAQRMAVGDAMARGGELQLRVTPGRLATDATRVELVLVNRDGEAAEIVRVLFGLPAVNDAGSAR